MRFLYSRHAALIMVGMICGSLNAQLEKDLHQKVDADWMVIGAGPAGIATVGVLLDIGVDQNRIIWLDPEFQVGRLQNYGEVHANGVTAGFIKFINSCAVFQECSTPSIVALNSLDPQQYNALDVVIEPLRDLSAYLRTKVSSVQDFMKSLYFADDSWTVVTASDQVISGYNVVLATGSHPAVLDYEQEKVISLDIALNPHNLARILKPDDIVGVVGNSHSGVLLLKFLTELPFQLSHIYNLYRSPLTYVVDMGDWKLNEFNGLKGEAALWAQSVLEKNPPANMTRLKSTPEVLESTLNKCTKVVYAIGYEQNALPLINDSMPITMKEAGVIAPRLFGIGIAFPELVTNAIGVQGHCIGLNSFMRYVQQMIPQWNNQWNEQLNSSDSRLVKDALIKKAFFGKLTENCELFNIMLL